MSCLPDMAHAIDSAEDAGDEELLREFGDYCKSQLSDAKGEDLVRLRYYQSNTYAAIIASKADDPDYT